MAKRLKAFPRSSGWHQPKYPWAEWTDGGVWEIRRGEDYEVTTENMRATLHVKADALCRKVRTHRISEPKSEGLVFQFIESDETEVLRMAMQKDPKATRDAIEHLHADTLLIYERAREEVRIPRKDGRSQRYAATRYRKAIEKGYAENALVPTIGRLIRKRTLGFGHLERAQRPDLMLETLVLDKRRPYHDLFSASMVQLARDRMAEYAARNR